MTGVMEPSGFACPAWSSVANASETDSGAPAPQVEHVLAAACQETEGLAPVGGTANLIPVSPP